MMWCDVSWCDVMHGGAVCCGVVWCGVVWCGVVWCGVVFCTVLWGYVIVTTFNCKTTIKLKCGPSVKQTCNMHTEKTCMQTTRHRAASAHTAASQTVPLHLYHACCVQCTTTPWRRAQWTESTMTVWQARVLGHHCATLCWSWVVLLPIFYAHMSLTRSNLQLHIS